VSGRLLTTAQVADQLSTSHNFVRAHAAELGAIKLGHSRQAPLRFERERVAEWLERRRLAAAPVPLSRRRRGPRHKPADVQLLDVRRELLR
jgi:hypothetical protein